MTIRLYLTPLPEQTGDRASDQIGSQIQQAGLLETGGVAVENVATDNVDFRKRGRIQFGPQLSRKVGEELESLSESSYTSLPLFQSSGTLARKRGYYEVTRTDVTPVQESRDDGYEYDVSLAKAGTREDSLREVRTNPQAANNAFAIAGQGTPLVGISAKATDVKWYTDANGTEPATAVETVSAEFGDVERYDPETATGSTPSLTYDLNFADDGPVDVRVLDTRDRSKFATTVKGNSVNVWTHAYHTGYQFDGTPVIDTGRFRLYLGEDPTGSARTDVAAETWDDSAGSWTPVGLDSASPWTLQEWSLSRIRPARVTVRTEWSDGTTTAFLDGVLERGADGVAWLIPENASAPPTALNDYLNPTARATDTLPFATQGLIDRSTRDA